MPPAERSPTSQDRLARTRLPQPSPTEAVGQATGTAGTPNSYLARSRRGAGATGSTGRAAAGAASTPFPHFTTEIDGQTIHFIHVRSPHEGATPLLLAHTYPGSSVDYLDMIGRAHRPGGARWPRRGRLRRRHARMRPGYGFSPAPGRRLRLDRRRGSPRPTTRLMRRLGYDSLRHPRLRQRRDGRPGARPPRTRRGSSACTCCSCSRSRPATRQSSRSWNRRTTPGLEHMQWFQSVGGVQHDERRPARRRSRSRCQRLPGRPPRLQPSCSTRSATAPRSCRSTTILHRGQRRTWFANAAAGMSRSLPATTPCAEARMPRVNERAHRRRRLQGRLPDDPASSPSATTRTSCTGAASNEGGHFAALERSGAGCSATSARSSPWSPLSGIRSGLRMTGSSTTDPRSGGVVARRRTWVVGGILLMFSALVGFVARFEFSLVRPGTGGAVGARRADPRGRSRAGGQHHCPASGRHDGCPGAVRAREQPDRDVCQLPRARDPGQPERRGGCLGEP